MTFKTLMMASAVALASFGAVQPGMAQESGIKAGTLRCNVSSGLGAIITSTRDMSCSFIPTRGRAERYVGTIQRFGLDIGATTRGVMVWGVIAEQRGLPPGSLAGNYAGVSGEATVGAGAGANVLVGGSNRSISLQPVSVQGQLGLSLAAGVAELRLARVVPARRAMR